MSDVLALTFTDGSGIGWSDGIGSNFSLTFDMMSDWIHECSLLIWKLDDKGITMRRNESGVLTINYSGNLVSIFGDKNFHSPMRVDGISCHQQRTCYCTQWNLIREEFLYYNFIYSLGSCTGNSHHGSV